jgi:penicillin-binding protein 2
VSKRRLPLPRLPRLPPTAMSDPGKRLKALQIIFGLILVVFLGRLWELQFTRWVAYAREAAGNRTQVIRTEPLRGLILDRAGRCLAQNRSCWRVGVDPTQFPRHDEYESTRCIFRLASILKVPSPRLRQAIEEALAASPAQPVPLEGVTGPLTLEMVARLEEHHFDLPGIVVLETSQRFYPYGSLAAHVLGYVRAITAEQYAEYSRIPVPAFATISNPDLPLPDPLYSRSSQTGQAGVEAAYELDRFTSPPLPVLMGLPGRKVLEVNVQGQPIRVIASRLPQPGATVYLCLDAHIQQVGEQALDEQMRAGHGRSGAVVVVEVNTGKVIALCSRPSFNPNAFVKGLSAAQWRALTKDPRAPLVNRAYGSAFPPGSVFKIISAVAAFQTAHLRPQDGFVCSGRISVGPKHMIYRCWRSEGHGHVDFWRGLAESCDVYFYALVREKQLTPEALAYWARQFGLGRLTNLGLTGEASGLVPDPQWKLLLRRDRWRLGDSLNLVIGQGWLTVTPLQMAMATAALANGGILYRPLLVEKIVWPAWMNRAPWVARPEPVGTLGAAPQTLAYVRRAMRLAVASPQGTARALAQFPIPVAGKTGSAEHDPRQPTHAWFVCFAPADQPRYALAVFLESGGHGGSVAAPVARKVLAALFRTAYQPALLPARSD